MCNSNFTVKKFIGAPARETCTTTLKFLEKIPVYIAVIMVSLKNGITA